MMMDKLSQIPCLWIRNLNIVNIIIDFVVVE